MKWHIVFISTIAMQFMPNVAGAYLTPAQAYGGDYNKQVYVRKPKESAAPRFGEKATKKYTGYARKKPVEKDKRILDFENCGTIFGVSIGMPLKQVPSIRKLDTVGESRPEYSEGGVTHKLLGEYTAEFTPKRKFLEFDRYFVDYTPKSKLVYRVYAFSSNCTSNHEHLAIHALLQKYPEAQTKWRLYDYLFLHRAQGDYGDRMIVVKKEYCWNLDNVYPQLPHSTKALLLFLIDHEGAEVAESEIAEIEREKARIRQKEYDESNSQVIKSAIDAL